MAITSTDRSTADDDSFLSFLRELPVLLLVAFLLAFLLRTFVVQVFYIPSSSMEPTLQVNDRMVVEKLSYLVREPERGDVIVFEGDDVAPTPERGLVGDVAAGFGQFLGVVPANARDFVKRVIGLPGETVTIDQGVVSVDGVPLDEPYLLDLDERDFGPYEVPEGQLFVLGDNRPNSSDSRFGLGYVAADQVVGRAMFVMWPFDHAGGIGDGELPEEPSAASGPLHGADPAG